MSRIPSVELVVVLLVAWMTVLLGGCAVQPLASSPAQCLPALAACPVCPVCPVPEVPKPSAKPLLAAQWEDITGWPGAETEDLLQAFSTFLASCDVLQKKAVWRETCGSARALEGRSVEAVRAWFESQLQPWQLVNPDGGREGLVTGYYEPLLKGSRKSSQRYAYPIYGVPADLIDVELGDLYPELKHMRLRGRIEGRKLLPYYSRADWEKAQRSDNVLVWADDLFDVFFMQIQGSGQVQLDDGSRTRVGYADQNGHPYRSIGRWLIDQGELKAEQASMQGIKAWARAHPERVQALLNANPSYVFFRELAALDAGPPGALGVPLTAERSIAVDARYSILGAPVWLATTWPGSERPLQRLMLAQDTGGAIRGPVRADFFWGSGHEAGVQAGKMRQKGRMWILLPRLHIPPDGQR
ncbi:MAG: MltA domain-containing protein [Sterolibacterium sp.]